MRTITKQSINIIAEPLSDIFNLSFASDIFSDDMKIARVIPLFKAGVAQFSQIIDQYLFSHVFQSYLKRLCIIV